MSRSASLMGGRSTPSFTPPNMSHSNVRFSDLVNAKISAYIRSSDPLIVAAHIIDFDIEKHAPFINDEDPDFESNCQAAYINNLGTPNASYFMPENFPSAARVTNIKGYKAWLNNLSSYKGTFMIPDVLLYDVLVNAAVKVEDEKFSRFIETCSNSQIMQNRPILWKRIYFRVNQLLPRDKGIHSFINRIYKIFNSEFYYSESELIQEVMVAVETWPGKITAREYSIIVHYFWKYCQTHMESLCNRNQEYNCIKFIKTKPERAFLVGSVANSKFYADFEWGQFIEDMYNECLVVRDFAPTIQTREEEEEINPDTTSDNIIKTPSCGFCGEINHKVKSCEKVLQNIQLGNLVKEQSRYFLSDGTRVVFNPILPPALIRYQDRLIG